MNPSVRTHLVPRMRALLPLILSLGAAGIVFLSSNSQGRTAPPGGWSEIPALPSDARPDATLRQDTLVRIDRVALLRDMSILAHDSMQGRRTGTRGAELARDFLLTAYPARGLSPVDGSHRHDFTFPSGGRETSGTNVLGQVRGSEFPERFIVLTAHYDHLGTRGSEIYNGADDNASGSAALLELARYLSRNPTRHSLLFVAFDAEEVGLRGAEAFVADPPIPLDSIVMNVNLDMVSRSEAGELYAVGTRYYPALRPLIAETAGRSRIRLLTGHDSPGPLPSDDWTFASDHGPFHRKGIPFIYFGVEDHAGYHTPDDTYEAITPDFYHAAVETILDFVLRVDEGEGDLRTP